MNEQPKPVENNSRPIFEMVCDDLRQRAETGKKKYGVYLQAGNGRDALQDAMEECLDMACYLKQAIIERDAKLAE